MIFLFTDFGLEGPYLGQIRAVLTQHAPDVPVINLVADAPTHDPALAAYLLRAVVQDLPVGSTFLCVVDPGVGTDRSPLALEVDGRWFVGPDNGLFNPLLLDAERVETFRIDWRPAVLSDSFHGRDLFAPIAARLARGERPSDGLGLTRRALPVLSRAMWPEDLARVIYVDHFGNVMTGMRRSAVSPTMRLAVAGRSLRYRRVFGEAEAGEAFWYCNSIGLVEVAVNRGRADQCLGVGLGAAISVLD